MRLILIPTIGGCCRIQAIYPQTPVSAIEIFRQVTDSFQAIDHPGIRDLNSRGRRTKISCFGSQAAPRCRKALLEGLARLLRL